jgi:murein DD-endopeptidase MepM/ murein hydrolase activator NlpD
LGLAIIAGIHLGRSQPLLAQYRPAATSTEPWRYASFPVENFQAYTSPFGYRISPVTGKRQFHQGLDIAAPIGSYVRNWWTGQVVSLSDHTACGTMIRVRSGQWTHTYCHLLGSVQSSPQGRYLQDSGGGIVLWEGQEIPVGARIGRVGMTGRTTGPHLHWELQYGREAIDPGLVLQQMFGQQISVN